jgi:hypothetical protein
MASLKRAKNKWSTLNGADYDVREASHKTARVTLPNGLKLVIYPKKHPKTRKLFKRCNEAEMKNWLDPPLSAEGFWSDHCMIRIHSSHVEVRLLIDHYPPMPKGIKAQIREKGLNKILTSTMYLEYKGRLYPGPSEEGAQLIAAIKSGVGLEVYQLLRDQSPANEEEPEDDQP